MYLESVFQRLFPINMCSKIAKICSKFAQICHAFRLEFGYVLCVLLWKTNEYGKTHNFWYPFPYFRMGIDSDAKIDPKLVYFRHIPIIYTQTSVVSVFLRFARGVSAWIAFRPWVFAILLFSLWVLVWNGKPPESPKKSRGLELGNQDPPAIQWKFRERFALNRAPPGLSARPACPACLQELRAKVNCKVSLSTIVAKMAPNQSFR